jgi:hypothetical protein
MAAEMLMDDLGDNAVEVADEVATLGEGTVVHGDSAKAEVAFGGEMQQAEVAAVADSVEAVQSVTDTEVGDNAADAPVIAPAANTPVAEAVVAPAGVSDIDGKLAALFEKQDKDGSGAIDKSELKAVLGVLGLLSGDASMDKFEAEQAMEDADADGNSTINFEEYVAYMKEQVEMADPQEFETSYASYMQQAGA